MISTINPARKKMVLMDIFSGHKYAASYAYQKKKKKGKRIKSEKKRKSKLNTFFMRLKTRIE